MTDFSTYQFRCSGLKNLMVKSRTKDALSETTKTYLRDIFIQETYGRHKPDIDTKYTKKGTMVEPDSMDLVKEVTGITYFKNNTRLENEFIKGTPDINPKSSDTISDIKSSWDIWTFAAVDEKKARDNYYWQVLGYMWLTGKTKGELLYCLVNTPDSIIEGEIYRLSFRFQNPEDANAFRVNYVFDDIEPKQLRLKKFTFDYSQDDVDALQKQVVAAREYLKGLAL